MEADGMPAENVPLADWLTYHDAEAPVPVMYHDTEAPVPVPWGR
jgi:hypothetical protein